MALIRATCGDCGDVELRSRDLTVNIFTDNSHNPIKSEYCFCCPVCRMIETKSADDQVIDILASAGVKVKEIVISRDMLDHVAQPSNVVPIFGESKGGASEATPVLQQLPEMTENEMIDYFRPRHGQITRFEEELDLFLKDPVDYKKEIDPLTQDAQDWYNANISIENHIANKPEIERVIAELQELGLTQIDSDRIIDQLKRFPNSPRNRKVETTVRKHGSPQSLEVIASDYYATLSKIEDEITAKQKGASESVQVRALLEGSALPQGIVSSALAVANLSPTPTNDFVGR